MRCEFQTIDSKKIGNSSVYTKQSNILLEPRFRYDDVEEISEEEYKTQAASSLVPFIKRTEKSDVEFTFKNSGSLIRGSIVKEIDEIILVLKNDNSIFDDGERYVDSNILSNFTKEEQDPPKEIFYSINPKDQEAGVTNPNSGHHKFYSPFNTFTGKGTQGKIKGLGFCKEVEYLDENNIPLSTSNLKKLAQKKTDDLIGYKIPEAVTQRGCFGKTLGSRINDVTSFSTEGNKGCFGRSIIPPFGSLNAGSNSNGCFGPQAGGRGCFPFLSGGCSGCLFPFLLLLLLASLLWGLFGMKGCQNNQTPPPIIIHDTIKVEVQKIDTLTIVKTDTISYVDSTTKLNYETVSLPNVQFITNSDVLLPSSASDLQKLAEYLIKNDSLNATIFGHTDNVGRPEENLKLSQRRAESVVKFLSSLGVDSRRLSALGKGDKEPKADNNLDEGRMINRRVEVQLTNTEVVTTTRTKKEESKKAKD